MKIVLIGLPASGKSTLGQKLANKLGIIWMDTDTVLTQSESKSINEIFAMNGETNFRQKEKTVIQKLLEKEDDMVISTGGGLPCFDNNIQIINDYSTSIFIDVSLEELSERIKSNQERPMFLNMDEHELGLHLKNLSESRRRYYLQADIIIQTENMSAEEIIDLIINKLGTVNKIVKKTI